MNRDSFKNHSMIMALDNDPCIIPDEPFVDDNSEIANVLKEIFAVDDRTGLPQGEIAYYLSPDGNPQIKEWLLNNLMRTRSFSVGGTDYDVTDDMLEEFSRQPNESLGDYRKRIYDIGLEAKKFIESQNFKEE